MEIPDGWTIIKIVNEDSSILYKVFASWIGGYTTGDSWKLNSGIESTEEDDTHFHFYGYSGSHYKCYKTRYGNMTSYHRNILETIMKRSEGSTYDVEVLTEEEYLNLNL